MSRTVAVSILALSLLVGAPPSPGAARADAPVLAAEAAPTCGQQCLAEQRDCLASETCTSGSPAAQKECRRVCEQTYRFCVAACE
jgi:hypothetical protein